MPQNSIFELQRTFEKFAEGRISRKCNFDRALTHAIRDGFLEAALVAEIQNDQFDHRAITQYFF